jgi:hypothetical protein
MTLEYDSATYQMPTGVSYGDDPPLLQVNSRGIFTSSDSIPQTIEVTFGQSSRALQMSATGQITFGAY